MRRACALSCLLALGAASALAQSGPTKILIASRTEPASAGQEAAAIASYFENRVQELLMDRYPCADPLTRSDVKALLEWDRQRALLDANYEGGLGTIAGAIGANYYVSLTVSPLGSSQVALSAAVTNAANAQTVARTTSTTGGGSAALKGVDVLAQQLVESFSGISRFSKDKCSPTNAWIGTVTYLAADSHKDEREEQAPSAQGEGTITSTTDLNSSYQATIRIGWTGEPKAHVVASETRRLQEIGKIRYDCGIQGRSNVHNWKSAGYDNLTTMESTAVDDAVGSVAVSIAGGRIRLRINVPEIEGTTKMTDRKKFDGACDKPGSSQKTDETPWQVKSVQHTVEAPAGANADEQSGSFKDDAGATLTWKLTRTPVRK